MGCDQCEENRAKLAEYEKDYKSVSIGSEPGAIRSTAEWKARAEAAESKLADRIEQIERLKAVVIRTESDGAKKDLHIHNLEVSLEAARTIRGHDVCQSEIDALSAALDEARKEKSELIKAIADHITKRGEYKSERDTARVESDEAKRETLELSRVHMEREDHLKANLAAKHAEIARITGKHDKTVDALSAAVDRIAELEAAVKVKDEALSRQIESEDHQGYSHDGCRSGPAKCYLCRALSPQPPDEPEGRWSAGEWHKNDCGYWTADGSVCDSGCQPAEPKMCCAPYHFDGVHAYDCPMCDDPSCPEHKDAKKEGRCSHCQPTNPKEDRA